MEFGTGWGRTRHVVRSGSDGRRGVCGAGLTPLVPADEVAKKPLCKLCARERHINPCTRCGGTGQEPGEAT